MGIYYHKKGRYHTVNQGHRSPTRTHHVKGDEISVREGITVSMPVKIGGVLIVA